MTMNTQTTPLTPLMKPAEAALILGLSVKQLGALRRHNRAPKAYVLGARLVRFDRADVMRRAAL